MPTLDRLLKYVSHLPPVRALRVAARGHAFESATGTTLFRGVYRSFPEARAVAPHTKPVGYDNHESARMYDERLTRVYPADYPILFWLNSILKDVRRVFEFGGHVGVAFYAYEPYLTYPAHFEWTIRDVPAVIARGRALAAQRGRTQLTFTPEREAADGADLFLASGSLQYVDEPIHVMLDCLRRRPLHVMVNRTPLYDGDSFVTLQNIGTAFCPYCIFNRMQFLDSVRALGYELVDEWENFDIAAPVEFGPERTIRTHTGMYFRLK